MIEDICRDKAEQAVQLLIDLIEDRDAPPAQRLQAAREILDRGYGKPVDRSVAVQLGTGTGAGADEYLIPDRELRRIASGALERLQAGDRGGQVIEIRRNSAPDSE